MKFSPRTISELAEMICGASGIGDDYVWPHFPYRSSSQLTRFFRNCDLEYVHDGSTRQHWVEHVLDELNKGAVSVVQLPPNNLIRVIQEMLDVSDYQRSKLDHKSALVDLNKVMERDGIEAYVGEDQRCYIRSIDKQVTSTSLYISPRPLTSAELAKRRKIERFLAASSEDEFIEGFLIPLFRQLGFLRVVPTGHRDKSLEYGKDIWMKYRLPTGHYIYFTAQVKRDKISASGRDLTKNISGILAQARMALDHPIFDPENNRKHLLDHVYIISADFITKQARMLLIEHLDREARRHIIFMDKEELLDLGILSAIELLDEHGVDDIPF